MPTYIAGDIPVGAIQSGELILKNVVIETALPYKPPTDGSPRQSIICEGDTCWINPDFIPSPDERAVLFDETSQQIATADGDDIRQFLISGWKLVGVFDPQAAERIADRLAANPPINNDAVQKDIWWSRSKHVGVAMVSMNTGQILALAGREKALKRSVETGRVKPVDPVKTEQKLLATHQSGEQTWRQAENVIASIDAALGNPTINDYVAHYLLVDPSVETGGEMESFFSNMYDSSGRLFRVDSVDPALFRRVWYRYPDYPPLVRQRAMGRKILGIYVARTGSQNPYVNAPFRRVDEWNSRNPSRRVATSANSADGLV